MTNFIPLIVVGLAALAGAAYMAFGRAGRSVTVGALSGRCCVRRDSHPCRHGDCVVSRAPASGTPDIPPPGVRGSDTAGRVQRLDFAAGTACADAHNPAAVPVLSCVRYLRPVGAA